MSSHKLKINYGVLYCFILCVYSEQILRLVTSPQFPQRGIASCLELCFQNFPPCPAQDFRTVNEKFKKKFTQRCFNLFFLFSRVSSTYCHVLLKDGKMIQRKCQSTTSELRKLFYTPKLVSISVLCFKFQLAYFPSVSWL